MLSRNQTHDNMNTCSLKDIEEGMTETEKICTLHEDSSKDLDFGSVIGFHSEHSDPSGTASRSEEPISPEANNDDEKKSGGSSKAQPTKDKKTSGTKGSSGSKIVYIGLFLAALGLGLATYFILSSQQQNEFESEFGSFAREVVEISENNAGNAFGQLQTLATVITSIAYDSKDGGFPNVTIPHFDLRAQEIAALTGAEMIMFAPFVEKESRAGWEEYEKNNRWWIEQDYKYRGWNSSNTVNEFNDQIYQCAWCADAINDTRRGFVDEDGFMENILSTNGSLVGEGLTLPVAQFGPGPTNIALPMFDLFSHPTFKKEVVASLEYDVPVISEPLDLSWLLDSLMDNYTGDELRSFTLDQVKEDFLEDSRTIGYVIGVIPWSRFFANLLPENVNGLVVNVVSDCGKEFTYIINGGKDDWSAEGDWHDPKYDMINHTSKFFWKAHPKGQSRHCHFDLIVYPSDDFYSRYDSNAVLYACIVAFSFVFAALFFYLYSIYVHRRQVQDKEKIKRAEAIVNSVFPEQFGRRLIQESEERANQKSGIKKQNSGKRLRDFIEDSHNGRDLITSKPLADLFLDCTVMFADITGFTAWSSTRDPTQVFTLLESIYREFDAIANRLGVFKVETVGDCYVAVAGLPTPMVNHHITMVLFAGECVNEMGLRTKLLEVALGPDTADLGIRVGLHSGPVTAGILRGERARFQLFGDTVNTTARIESSGERNRIHISSETAELLIASGKGHWIKKREDTVSAKGKGMLSTYWITYIKGGAAASTLSSSNTDISSSDVGSSAAKPSRRKKTRSGLDSLFLGGMSEESKKERLVDWNAQLLQGLLKQIEANRRSLDAKRDPEQELRLLEKKILVPNGDETVLDEVVEIVNLPNFNSNTATSSAKDLNSIDLSPQAADQLKTYVKGIADMYQTNPFHNFSHASHVTQSVTKLLGRITAPDITSDDAKDLHDHTYGITSDPLTQFSVVLSALLHDVDHSGVPNSTLVEEERQVAVHYKNKSVLEQNSIDLAWDYLMEDEFVDLRRAIYTTKEDCVRFRQILVNTILATDIMDKELKALRNQRWNKAFNIDQSSHSCSSTSNVEDDVNRKATIVIEHLIQASDVSHTMQHWHVFRKWNEMLFMEMYQAFKEGRSKKDPLDFWYQGELSFFDFYVIPLAKKLQSCGVFGVSSAEFLDYARRNRAEWELKGRAVVEGFKEKVKSVDFDKMRRTKIEDDEFSA